MPSADELGLLSDRLDKMSDRIDKIYEILSRSSAPSDFLTVAEAANAMHCKTKTIYEYIDKGVFRPGTELINIGPEGAKQATWRVSVKAYYARLSLENSLLVS